MVRWVIGSILHGLDPLSYFSFQPVLHNWCNKGCGMCCPVCGMVHIKEPLLLIGKRSPCGGSGFPLSLSEWSKHHMSQRHVKKQLKKKAEKQNSDNIYTAVCRLFVFDCSRNRYIAFVRHAAFQFQQLQQAKQNKVQEIDSKEADSLLEKKTVEIKVC